MTDKVMEIWKKIYEKMKAWWNQFQPKQKTLIVCVGVAIVVAITILVAVLTKKQYESLVVCESTKEASQIQELLEGDGLDYKVSSDGLSFTILKEQVSDANLLLGANNIPTSAYTLDDVLDGNSCR